MSESIKGMIHVHSDFSSDGLHSVADLADFARQSGFRFVGLTDHAEDLSFQDIHSLRRQCEEYSDESCIIIPGLEFRCSGDIHILGLGVTHEIISDDPVTVANQIQSSGGIAILAHPARNGYECPAELYRVLNGIEIWNAGYDGRFVPPLANLRLLQEARAGNPNVLGFGGADLHVFDRPPGVLIELQSNGATRVDAGSVLDCLRGGAFSMGGRYMSFDAKPSLDWLARFRLWAFRKLYETSKLIRDFALQGAWEAR